MSLPTPCELRVLSGGLQASDPDGVGSGPHPGQKIPRLEACGGAVDRCGLQVGAGPKAVAVVGSGTSAVTAAMPKPSRRLFGQACGPSMSASAMILPIFR